MPRSYLASFSYTFHCDPFRGVPCFPSWRPHWGAKDSSPYAPEFRLTPYTNQIWGKETCRAPSASSHTFTILGRFVSRLHHQLALISRFHHHNGGRGLFFQGGSLRCSPYAITKQGLSWKNSNIWQSVNFSDDADIEWWCYMMEIKGCQCHTMDMETPKLALVTTQHAKWYLYSCKSFARPKPLCWDWTEKKVMCPLSTLSLNLIHTIFYYYFVVESRVFSGQESTTNSSRY